MLTSLIISILISLGIQFTVLESGQVEISSKDMATLQSSEEFTKLDPVAAEGITVNDGVDPNTSTDSKE